MKAIEKFVSKNIRTGFAVHKRSNFRYSPVFLVVASLCGHLGANAQQIGFEQEPPVAVSRQPAPNLIISLDDSGSMVDTSTGRDDIKAVREVLTTLIADETLFPDDSIRLGWNSMNKCPSIGYSTSCNNGIRRLNTAQRNRFTSWLNNSYAANGSTPSHRALWNAGKFFDDPIPAAGTSARHDSPWVANPGISDPANNEEPLKCRRNYVVFFTDGGFNTYWTSDDYHGIGNYDGKNHTLPDGGQYSISSDQTKIYRDNASSVITRKSGVGTYYSWVASGSGPSFQRINYETTLSDITFYFWSRPLQGWKNVVKADYKVNVNETHTRADGTKLELEPYWNPKNNPATWSHINFFTIGYSAASDWRNSFLYSPNWQQWHGRTTNPPEFDWNGDINTATWTGQDYSRLITGDLEWVDPLKTILGAEPSSATSGESSCYAIASTPCSQCVDYAYSPFASGAYYTTNGTLCGNGDTSPQRGGDLWHAAINARGRFVPAPDSKTMAEAFKSILSGLELGGGIRNSGTAPTGTSSSAFSTGSKIFIANFDPDGWQGDVSMYEIQYTYSGGYTTGTATAATSLKEGWGKKTAGSILTDRLSNNTNAVANRFVMMKGAGDAGVPFKVGNTADATALDNFSPEAQAGLLAGNASPSTADYLEVIDKINYIRGDQGKEIKKGGLLRDRPSLLGDIVNSNIWFTPAKPASDYYLHQYYYWRSGISRTPMIYVGANDGMLHGFDADTGEEKIAYVPSAFLIQPEDAPGSGTRSGTAPIMVTPNDNYVHRYYADGPVFTADLDLEHDSAPKIPGIWKTYLAGALGAGGKGYYILDVTDPKEFQSGNEKDLLIADTSDGMAMAPAHAGYIGHIFGEPVREQGNTSISRQITKINYSPSGHDVWAFITNNGYNSAEATPALFVHILGGPLSEKNRIIRLDVDCEIDMSCLSTVSTSNGLSTPRLIDLNGDNVPDVAYAGDLKGNVWRFDLSPDSVNRWLGTASPSSLNIKGKRIFTAVDSSNKRQPITSAPVWMAHPDGGIMLAFGTGRLLTPDDRTDNQTQTIYGIYDNAVSRNSSKKGDAIVNPLAFINKGDLVEQKISDSAIAITNDGKDSLWSVTSESVNYKLGQKGWYLNLPAKSGERIIENPDWFDGKLIHIYSQVPAAIQTASSSNPTPVGESCESVSVNNSKSYRTTINIINGNAPTSTIYNYTPPTGPDVGNAARIEYSRGFLVNDGKHQYNICPGGDCSAAGLPGTPGSISGTSITDHLRRIAVEPSWIQVR